VSGGHVLEHLLRTGDVDEIEGQADVKSDHSETSNGVESDPSRQIFVPFFSRPSMPLELT
jgi:hypothetical protein